ncbi:hypothetical protein ATY77_29610 [Rhizobium sp. R634]|uniref:DUF4276 family protein n=1 Tax=Rhizobium sp. R634 TaxID=1764274 RepID=UPI000B52B4DA|nr:DUF4276 family protein [Rhizobium sp. R634]OWV78026.1 hypothetical protein ATY77_29610 [Rhizobium sp. R634]
MLYVYPIVEGHGDERALPVLIRKLLNERFGIYEVDVAKAYRLPKGKMKRAEEWPGILALARERLQASRQNHDDKALILVVCDADEECPVELKELIEKHMGAEDAFVKHAFVAPQPEYETWFLAAADSFANHADCVQPIPPIGNLLQIRDAKGYFERNILKQGRFYSETVDQPKFSALVSFALQPENGCRSLKRFIDVFDRLIAPAQ